MIEGHRHQLNVTSDTLYRPVRDPPHRRSHSDRCKVSGARTGQFELGRCSLLTVNFTRGDLIVVPPEIGRGQALAHRLRALREGHWPDRPLTQNQLATALGGDKGRLSTALISSWENLTKTKIPPSSRLVSYATFFATRRSIEQEPFRILSPTELTGDERATRDALLQELANLRAAAIREQRPTALHTADTQEVDDGGLWHFPDGREITIVCAELPDYMRQTMPYADPRSPDYVELSTYADLDALIELYGHLRATNPYNQVNFRTHSSLTMDDLTTHLALLGGVDWNTVTRDLLERVHMPVRQSARDAQTGDGYFEVADGEQRRRFAPTVDRTGDGENLLEDVAHFFRTPNPLNRKRTLTICNGMFARGTLGAVRALTDTRFRRRNEDYIRARFQHNGTFSIISRVPIVNGKGATPDWSDNESRLHEWAEVQ
jgi:hypothetical protein